VDGDAVDELACYDGARVAKMARDMLVRREGFLMGIVSPI
jgi:hypothetical protein